MKKILKIGGFTLTEVILTLTILGIVIIPIMTLFVLSAKINHESSNEYKTFLEAQKYMEEIKSLETIDCTKYIYNTTNGIYEGTVIQTDNKYGAIIKIIPRRSLLYFIEVYIIDDGVVVNSLIGSKIIH